MRRDEHDEKGSEEVVMGNKKGVDAGDESAGSGRSKDEDEERYKALEKVLEVKKTRRPDTLRYIEKKLRDKGIQRMERHPVDGLSLAHGPPKSGHGGKFTWEGPADVSLEPAPPAVDAKDPNYVEEEEEDAEVAAGIIKGEVEVAKEAKEGVSRIEVQPPLRSLLTD